MLDAQNSARNDPRIYFAAERTFLAWLRTGLALMGVGFAVSRFGLFLQQIRSGAASPARSTGPSVYAGVALVALGVVVIVAAVYSHVRTVRLLRTGAWQPGVSFNAVALALTLAAIGLAIAVFLLAVR